MGPFFKKTSQSLTCVCLTTVCQNTDKTDRTARETDESTIVIEDFNNPLSEMDRSSGKSGRTQLNPTTPSVNWT